MLHMAHPPLSLEPLEGSLPIGVPSPVTHLHADSPARALLTDFTRVRAQAVNADTSASQARDIMQTSGVRLLLVSDAAGQCTGIIDAKDLLGGRRITQAMQQHGIARHEVTVGMVQTACSDLHALSLARLDALTIGELIEALKAFGSQHLLITDRDEHQTRRIRGLISASDVRRALSLGLNQPLPEARSFSEVCRVILGREL